MSAPEDTPMEFTLEELAAQLEGQVEGDPHTRVTGGAWRLTDARPGDLVRVESARWLAAAEEGPAAALLVGPGLSSARKPVLRVAHPSMALARALALFHPARLPPAGVHPTAVIGEEVEIGEGAAILAQCVIGPRVRIGRRVVLHPHVVVGEGVSIGDETEIYPNVTLYPGVVVGARVRIHSGAVLGADGFGYVANGVRRHKIPQVGGVEIGDDVEIGANTTIDRATTGMTRIGAGTKIDNLVQIGHNVQVGEHCILIAQVGLAGSVVVEDDVMIGGQAGVKEHVRIGRGSVVAGQAGVFGDLPPGSFVSGYPARPHHEQLQVQAAVQRLPRLQRTLRELERRVRALLGDDSAIPGER